MDVFSQNDILMGMLTVRENIAFSASLRLPRSFTDEEKTQRVTEVIEDLGLIKCADAQVSTAQTFLDFTSETGKDKGKAFLEKGFFSSIYRKGVLLGSYRFPMSSGSRVA